MKLHSYKGLLVLGVLTAIALVATFSIGGTARAQIVPTNATVSSTNLPPNIECKWELPDMNSVATGIQYTDGAPGHIHDDDMTKVPDADNNPANGVQVPCSGPPASLPSMPQNVHNMTQVKPNLEDIPERRRIELWAAVDHPNGISNISDVFWRVYHPDGSFKLQVHGTVVPTAECATLGTGTGPDGSMFEAAVHTGQLTAAAVSDSVTGMIAKCQQLEKALYHQEFPLSKDQPCGEYRIEATAVSAGGAFTTLVNYIDVICVFGLAIDFNVVDWGTITPGLVDRVSGDLLFRPTASGAPTAKNIGNDGMGLGVNFSTMIGAQFTKIIDRFDGCFGRSAGTILCIDPILPGVPTVFGNAPAQVLCANEVGKLDLSIHPPGVLPTDTYSGTVLIIGFAVSGQCAGSVHIGLPGCAGAVADICIDADGTASAGDGIATAAEVGLGRPLTPFPQPVFNGSGLDMFDNDANQAWTFGPLGDDLHVEAPLFCPSGIRNGEHEQGQDCVVLDYNGSLTTGQVVSCDLEVGAFCVAPLPSPITFNDANGNGAWDNGEDIVLDVNNDGVFD